MLPNLAPVQKFAIRAPHRNVHALVEGAVVTPLHGLEGVCKALTPQFKPPKEFHDPEPSARNKWQLYRFFCACFAASSQLVRVYTRAFCVLTREQEHHEIL